MTTSGDPLDLDPLCFLVGPTASGKSELGLALAERAGAEILSLDSMQVYRGLDVGTAKPGAQDRARIRHHLLDLAEARETYDVQRYLHDARAALRDIRSRGLRALFVGGTGLYLAAMLRGLFDGPRADPALRARLERRREELGAEAFHAELARVDPASAARIHAQDRKRVVRALEVWEQTGRRMSELQSDWTGGESARARGARIVGLMREPGDLERRIRERAEGMLDEGWAQEALRIGREGGWGPTARQALGYSEVLEWAEGRLDRGQALERIVLATRRFARRQRTWLAKFDVRWIRLAPGEPTADPEHVAAALRYLGWDQSPSSS